MLSPISGNELTDYMICKDHLVTKNKFSILIDEETELLVTSPQPSQKEIGKYYESDEYNSHSSESKTLFDKVYEFVKTINIKSKYSIIEKKYKYNSNSSILDIGCGAGDFLNFCKNKGWEVDGVEPTNKAREISESKLGIKISKNSSLDNFQDNSYDVVTMWHVLEHRFDIMETIAHLKRIVKPDGLIVIALPNYKSFDAEYYKQYWAAYDVPRHLFHFSRKTINIVFEKHKLKLANTKPMWFDAFYVSLISEKNKTGKLNLIRAIFIGLLSNIKSLSSKEPSSVIYISET